MGDVAPKAYIILSLIGAGQGQLWTPSEDLNQLFGLKLRI
jgi:hypothetical protein